MFSYSDGIQYISELHLCFWTLSYTGVYCSSSTRRSFLFVMCSSLEFWSLSLPDFMFCPSSKKYFHTSSRFLVRFPFYYIACALSFRTRITEMVSPPAHIKFLYTVGAKDVSNYFRNTFWDSTKSYKHKEGVATFVICARLSSFSL